MELHRPSRDTISGLEKGLRDALHSAGYRVLNEVKSRHAVDESIMAGVLNAFAERFEKLGPTTIDKIGGQLPRWDEVSTTMR